MLKLVTILGAAPKGGVKRDDDFVDRLSNRYTVGIIVMFAVLISMTSWLGKPITCWCPKHFTGSHCKYTLSYCWIRNTYYHPFDEEIPHPTDDDARQYIIYYQWLPFILLLQAAMFYAPSIVWHGLNQKAGMDADHILQSAGKLHRGDGLKKKDIFLGYITRQMDRFLRAPKIQRQGWQARFKRSLNVICCHCFGQRMGNYLVVLYLFSKILYIVNCIGQILLLNALLKTDFHNFGIDFFTSFFTDYEYSANSPVFPRVTMCDFNVRRLGNVQRYTVQCVLPINLYSEKMYVFLWFWIVFLGIMTILSFLTWLVRSLSRGDRLKFIRNHLQTLGEMSEPNAEQLSAEFLDDYLKQDGAFLLRLIIHNTSNMCCTDIMGHLYTFWKENVRGKEDPDYDEDEADGEHENLMMT